MIIKISSKKWLDIFICVSMQTHLLHNHSFCRLTLYEVAPVLPFYGSAFVPTYIRLENSAHSFKYDTSFA